MPELKLHPEKGVNPRLMSCTACGKEYGVVLLGAHDGTCKCQDCGKRTIGSHTKCAACGSRNVKDAGTLDEFSPVAGGLCLECEELAKKEHEEQAAVVAAGGIYFRCTDCGARGAIKSTSPICKLVREHTKIAAPTPVGIEFTKVDCPECSPNKEEETTNHG